MHNNDIKNCILGKSCQINYIPALEAAKAWVMAFVNWYNNMHQHSGINFVTPSARHVGKDKKILIAGLAR